MGDTNPVKTPVESEAGQANSAPTEPVAGLDKTTLVYISIGYMISSSCLSVVNKWALIHWGYPATLTFLQLTVSWLVAMLAGVAGWVKVDRLDYYKMARFAPACFLFYMALASNLMLLRHATVDTFIVLRSTVPLLTLIGEIVFLGTPVPGLKVFGALLLIVAGGVGYVMVDSNFSVVAYVWGAIYVAIMVCDMILIKRIVTKVELTPWGLVLYNNLIASMIYPFWAFMTGELYTVAEGMVMLVDDLNALGVVLASCVFGVAISYFAMNARKALLSTSFAVLGVVCKFGTVVVNTTVWSHHASPIGILFMLLSLSGGILYQRVQQQHSTPKPQPSGDVEMAVPKAP